MSLSDNILRESDYDGTGALLNFVLEVDTVGLEGGESYFNIVTPGLVCTDTSRRRFNTVLLGVHSLGLPKRGRG